MKILIASDTYPPSVNGAAYFTYRLANALHKKGHEVYVICPSRSFSNTVTNNRGVIEYGVRSIHIPVYPDFRVSPNLIAKSGIRKAIREIAPDVIHIQNHFLIGKEVATVAKEFNLPIVGTNHFMPENLLHYFHLPEWAEKMLWRFGWKQCIDVFQKLDAVATPTHTAARLLKRAGFNNEVSAISCGISLDRFTPDNDGEYLRRKYRIPAHAPVLLYVGRLDKEKRLEVIVGAMPDILKKTPAHLVIAGMGKERPRLEALIRRLKIEKAVTFTGFIPDKDLQNIYRVADIFLMAGIAELQSIVTMEAMASGLPVVAVDAMALPELVHDGKNGYLFEDGNSHQLAEKVVSILRDKAKHKHMSQESLDIIRNHDIEKTISKYESLYEKSLNRA